MYIIIEKLISNHFIWIIYLNNMNDDKYKHALKNKPWKMEF